MEITKDELPKRSKRANGERSFEYLGMSKLQSITYNQKYSSLLIVSKKCFGKKYEKFRENICFTVLFIFWLLAIFRNWKKNGVISYPSKNS